MINKIKKYIFLNKQKTIFYVILFIYTLFLIWYSFNDVSIWWDESVYIGMGKYIATGGNLGMWEIFRPPLLPLIYSVLYKLNIPLIIAGKVIVMISSIGSVLLAYLITESIKKNSGIFSSIFLMITPIFFLYSRVPMTDIISIFFALLSILIFIRERYFLTGVFVALLFLLRFPQGLLLVPICLTCIYFSYNKDYFLWFKSSFFKLLYIFLGFIILVIPYLISNYLLYGNVLEPFILGNLAVSLSSELYDMGLFYYPKALFKIAPFLFLSLFTPILLFNKKFLEEYGQKRNLLFVLITLLIIFLYFFLQVHKELRYSLAFVPYLAILSGIYLYYIFIYFKRVKLFSILFVIGIIFSIYFSSYHYKDDTGYDYIILNNYFDSLNGKYISTTPIPAVFGNVHILSLFERATGFEDLFNKNYDLLNGVIIKDCDLFCKEKSITGICYNDLDIITNIVETASFKKDYEITINKCTFSIYKK